VRVYVCVCVKPQESSFLLIHSSSLFTEMELLEKRLKGVIETLKGQKDSLIPTKTRLGKKHNVAQLLQQKVDEVRCGSCKKHNLAQLMQQKMGKVHCCTCKEHNVAQLMQQKMGKVHCCTSKEHNEAQLLPQKVDEVHCLLLYMLEV